jgi:rSAM/selenodomain-associated transferase 1
MFKYPGALIMVFCKAPIPGQVKTRLSPHLTGEEAAQLHCELAEKTLQTATQKSLCDVQLWCTPNVGHPFFITMSQKYSAPRHLQEGADLGERMHHAICHALTEYDNAIIIGCDCPSLTSDDLEQAITQLTQDAQCVLSPAEDGGYVLIGLDNAEPALFREIPWGTDKVLETTRTRIKALNIRHHELTTQWDVDTYQDFSKYREMVSS